MTSVYDRKTYSCGGCAYKCAMVILLIACRISDAHTGDPFLQQHVTIEQQNEQQHSLSKRKILEDPPTSSADAVSISSVDDPAGQAYSTSFASTTTSTASIIPITMVQSNQGNTNVPVSPPPVYSATSPEIPSVILASQNIGNSQAQSDPATDSVAAPVPASEEADSVIQIKAAQSREGGGDGSQGEVSLTQIAGSVGQGEQEQQQSNDQGDSTQEEPSTITIGNQDFSLIPVQTAGVDCSLGQCERSFAFMFDDLAADSTISAFQMGDESQYPESTHQSSSDSNTCLTPGEAQIQCPFFGDQQMSGYDASLIDRAIQLKGELRDRCNLVDMGIGTQLFLPSSYSSSDQDCCQTLREQYATDFFKACSCNQAFICQAGFNGVLGPSGEGYHSVFRECGLAEYIGMPACG
eukprot:TRINITY_DN1212_c1_g1_i1.p1 TRINITY_DN1212_c1_g1~~TRINITY_DN1212_c1_g1_i1.p1  ORF type:complete len:409 (+),score=40.49 TRINITY_DN1212_c1_g1_i1:510-1736(+)